MGEELTTDDALSLERAVAVLGESHDAYRAATLRVLWLSAVAGGA